MNAAINNYVNDMTNQFIMGKETLNNFDNYIGQLKKLGIEDMLKIRQAALDRYNKR